MHCSQSWWHRPSIVIMVAVTCSSWTCLSLQRNFFDMDRHNLYYYWIVIFNVLCNIAWTCVGNKVLSPILGVWLPVTPTAAYAELEAWGESIVLCCGCQEALLLILSQKKSYCRNLHAFQLYPLSRWVIKLVSNTGYTCVTVLSTPPTVLHIRVCWSTCCGICVYGVWCCQCYGQYLCGKTSWTCFHNNLVSYLKMKKYSYCPECLKMKKYP